VGGLVLNTNIQQLSDWGLGTSASLPVVDYLVATPLDEEWRAFVELMPSSPKQINAGPAVYYLWTQRRPVGDRLVDRLVVGVSMGKMGIGSSIATLQHAVRLWRPAEIFLIGIAGSLDREHLRLGDVICSEQVYGYECGSVVTRNGMPDFKFEKKSTGYQASTHLFTQARAILNDQEAVERWRKECWAQAPPGLRKVLKGEKPLVDIEHATASGNFVVKTSHFMEQLRSIRSNIMAVEMEGKGLFEVVRSFALGAHAFMIRGISDYADENKASLDKRTKGGVRKYAAQNAARFLLALWEREYAPPVSEKLNLDTDLGPVGSLGPLVASRRYVLKAQNLCFSKLLHRETGTPALKITAVGRLAGKPLIPLRAECIVHHHDGHSSLRTHTSGKACIEFCLPPAAAPQRVEVFLVYRKEVECVDFNCEDLFGRSAKATRRF
jgi:nucleoside phosphorylase